MSKNVDLTSKEWCDLVFEGKNKAFGGYLLRVNSPKRYTWATIGVICVVAFAFVLPYIVESFKFGEVEEETTVVVEMTQLPEAEVEKQEVQPLVETPPPHPERGDPSGYHRRLLHHGGYHGPRRRPFRQPYLHR